MAKKRRLPPRDELGRFRKRRVSRTKLPATGAARRKKLAALLAARERDRRPPPPVKKPKRPPKPKKPRGPRLDTLAEQAAALGTSPEALQRAKDAARKQRRPVTELDIARAERDILRERLQKGQDAAERLVQQALDDNLGPHDVGPSGRDLYIEIAEQTGMQDREIYTMFRSPRQYGIAV